MRLVFVNNTHPDTPHVSGMRLFQFAHAMAQRGHQVVLLTGMPPEGKVICGDIAHFLEQLSTHDWGSPMILPVLPQRDRSLEAIRMQTVSPMLRKTLTAWHFIVHGGVFSDWTRAAKPIAATLAEKFSPDMVWATFGNTSNLALGKTIAKLARCPWIIDIKDNWNTFVPYGLRWLMALRFYGASGITSNAELQLEIARRWLRQPRKAVIYSGVSPSFYRARNEIKRKSNYNDIFLVGSTYSEAVLIDFMTSLKKWCEHRPDIDQTRLHYAGSDWRRVRKIAHSTGILDMTVVHGQLPLPELARMVRNATVACYLWAPFGFHHKLLELLVVGTPLISYPGEHAESLRLASVGNTTFSCCANSAQLHAALDEAAAVKNNNPPSPMEPKWRWSDFCAELEDFFNDIQQAKKRGATMAKKNK